MTDKPDIPARYQIAEAGFGAMLERHGFRLVPNARCHWRRDGDRVTWRVVIHNLTVDSVDAYWVHVNSGVYIEGFDERYAPLGDGSLSETLSGSRAKVHLQGQFVDTIVGYEKLRYEYETYGRKSWLGKLFYHLHPIERPRFGDWIDVPCISPVPHKDYFAFNLREHDVGWLAGEMARLFEKYQIPLMKEQMSIRGVYEAVYGPNSNMKSTMDPSRYLLAHLAGDDDFVQQMSNEQFATDKLSIDDIKAKLRKASSLDKERAKEQEYTETESATIQMLAYKFWNRALLNKLRLLDIPFEEPDIDFSILQRADQDWGWIHSHPDLETRRKLKAEGIDWTLPYRS